ncbi:leukocyte elastase inhibitor-like [Haliotis rufescens]|uniref:leukocyte elastase inhibitor-like n=1 Tax=Haliotis rufescens TaxID=6454 RepID=UPI00201F7D25|nr:leukocyte elastase inhibitor-like [Haliotis rufescens]
MAGSGPGLKTPDLVKQVATANSQFGLDLYKKVASDLKDSNVFLSPFSISAALAMTQLGARGDTAAQMNQVLKWTDLQDSVHPGFEDYLGLLKTQGDYVLTTANRLFISDTCQLLPDFLKDTMFHYEAETALADFQGSTAREVKKINAWVEATTNGKILNLIADLDPSTILVLVNAVYFKGSWEQMFSKECTNRDKFTVNAYQEVIVDMMHSKKKFNLCFDETLNCQILEMPYVGGDLAMYVLLPKCLDGLDELEHKLNVNTLEFALSHMQKLMVSVTLPKFTLQSSFHLNGILKSLGMTHAFDEHKADLSGIDGTRLLYISEVVHKAFLEVNEEGSEAAAATAVVVRKRKRVREDVEYFVANRPFLVIIKDKRADIVLFMGRLLNPCA